MSDALQKGKDLLKNGVCTFLGGHTEAVIRELCDELEAARKDARLLDLLDELTAGTWRSISLSPMGSVHICPIYMTDKTRREGSLLSFQGASVREALCAAIDAAREEGT